jgi:hypothetical protein
VGLMVAQVAQGPHPPAAALLQQHRCATTPFHQRGQQAPITAEGGLLARFAAQP